MTLHNRMHVTVFRGKCHCHLVSFHATFASIIIKTPLQFVSLDLPPYPPQTLVAAAKVSRLLKIPDLEIWSSRAESHSLLRLVIVERFECRPALCAWLMSAGAADYFHCDIESKCRAIIAA
jgi:hypothetical protein